MTASPDLFPGTKPPRAKPRVMMHMIDAGWAVGSIGRFKCGQCGHDSDWIDATDTDLRRGVPCPACNHEPRPGVEG